MGYQAIVVGALGFLAVLFTTSWVAERFLREESTLPRTRVWRQSQPLKQSAIAELSSAAERLDEQPKALQESPVGERPRARVVVAYQPYQTVAANVHTIQTFSLIESWMTVFHIKPPTSVPPSTSYNFDTVRHAIMWAELGNFTFASFGAAAPGFATVDPEGPPLITDIIIVSDPRSSDVHRHPICTKIYASAGGEHLIEATNIRERIRKAEQKLAIVKKAEPQRLIVRDALLGESRCFYIPSGIVATQLDPVWLRHPAMNSVAFLVIAELQDLFLQYDLLLRSDGDTFLTPNLNIPGLIPWKLRRKGGDFLSSTSLAPLERTFFYGTAGYSGEPQNALLKLYSEYLGLRHQGVHSIGSTVVGPPAEIITIAKLAVAVAEVLLKHDNVFRFQQSGGEWPKWYRGVTSMYASEVAVNHLVPKYRMLQATALADGSSASRVSLLEVPAFHLHCWHTSDFFSKFAMSEGQYSLTVYEEFVRRFTGLENKDAAVQALCAEEARSPASSNLTLPPLHTPDPLLPPWYSYAHALMGNDTYYRNLLSQLEEYPEELWKGVKNAEPGVNVSREQGHLSAPFQKLQSYVCPQEYPYPYLNGAYCCEKPIDCNGKELKPSSSCCKDYHHRICGGGLCDAANATEQPETNFAYGKWLRKRLRDRFVKSQSV